MGQGFHAGPGKDHAEIVAIKDVARAYSDAHLTGGTMYVTLEPCCHHGRTPPCTDALIRAGFSRVVVGAIDPSDRVNGRGIAQLRDAGIAVDLADGDLAYRLRRQNDAFRKHATRGLPFVTYKYAMTLDGRIATETGHSQWISGEESRAPGPAGAGLVGRRPGGGRHLRADDPRLTVRALPVLRQPLRVVVDPRLSIERSAALVRTADEGPVLIVCSRDGAPSPGGWRSPPGAWMVVAAARRPLSGSPGRRRGCSARGTCRASCWRVAPRLAAAWWEAGLVDRVLAFVAPVLAGGAGAPGPLPARGLHAHGRGAAPARRRDRDRSATDALDHRLSERAASRLMFTGLVEEVGTVLRLVRRGAEGAHLFLRAERVLEGTRLGDSIDVNGACLTVVELGSAAVRGGLHGRDRWSGPRSATCAPATRSTWRRAMALGDRLGGHLVLGHVDGVGTVLSVTPRGIAQEVRVSLPPELRGYVAGKGSIAVDGISLTVTDVTDEDFGLGLIPHTLAHTTLRAVALGRRVNLEADVLARYVRQATARPGRRGRLLAEGRPRSRRRCDRGAHGRGPSEARIPGLRPATDGRRRRAAGDRQGGLHGAARRRVSPPSRRP